MKYYGTCTLLLLLTQLHLINALFGINLSFKQSRKENPFQQWELSKELSSQPKNFKMTSNALNNNLFSPNLALQNDVFNEDEYRICVNRAIEPVYASCMTTDPKNPTSLKSLEKAKMAIDLLICELKSIYQNSFNSEKLNSSSLNSYDYKGNEMNMLIYNILALEKMYTNAGHKKINVNFYKEVLELIKQNNNLWTTYTLKNEKLDKLCMEFSQPFQKLYVKNLIKQYTQLLQEEILLNNKITINAIRDLESYLHAKMEEVSNDMKNSIKEEVKSNFMQVKNKIDVLGTKQKELLGIFNVKFENFTFSNSEALKNVTSIISMNLKKQKNEIDSFVKESFILKKEYFYFSKIFSNCYKLCFFMFNYKYILAVVVLIYWKYKTIISLSIILIIAFYLIAIDLINYFNLENVSQQIFNEILPQLVKKAPKIIMAVIVVKKIPQFWAFRKSFSIVLLYFTDIFVICLSTYDQQKTKITILDSRFNANIETNSEFLILSTIALNLYFKSWTSIKIKLIVSLLILLFVLSTIFITEYKFI